VSPKDKPLAWLHGEVKTPPFSKEARLEVGYLLRLLQRGDSIVMPHSRPMPTIGAWCHELRIQDAQEIWRIVYRIDVDAIVLVEVFSKKTGKTPKRTIDLCRKRLKDYDSETK
jgi:phage-related protein